MSRPSVMTLPRVTLLQALQHVAAMNARPFAAHNATLHIDFPKSMLRGVRSCQLQVVLANTGAVMTGRKEGKEWAALDGDVFAQYTWSASRAQASSDAVTLRLGMSQEKFDDFKAKHPAAKSLPPALFNDYTIVHNYVPNFSRLAATTQCVASQSYDAKRYVLTSPAKTSDVVLKFNCSASEVFPLPPFYMLLSSSAGSESVMVTSLAHAAGLCQATVTRTAPLSHEQPPAGHGRHAWSCKSEYFGDNVTCDCGCGAPDPDCLLDGTVVAGCGSWQPLCDHWGKCSAEETSTRPLRVFLSTPCSSLLLAGACFILGRPALRVRTSVFLSDTRCHQAAAARLASRLFRRNRGRRAACAPMMICMEESHCKNVVL